ncbi:MAG: hypothetical protein ACE5JS_22600, partial [Nitrospinota bacterium]
MSVRRLALPVLDRGAQVPFGPIAVSLREDRPGETRRTVNLRPDLGCAAGSSLGRMPLHLRIRIRFHFQRKGE